MAIFIRLSIFTNLFIQFNLFYVNSYKELKIPVLDRSQGMGFFDGSVSKAYSPNLQDFWAVFFWKNRSKKVQLLRGF